jgi:hypothetical protein
VFGDECSVLRLAQPLRELLADVQPGELLRQHFSTEKVPLHEVAEHAPDLIFARRDDRRVRDRNAERMTE